MQPVLATLLAALALLSAAALGSNTQGTDEGTSFIESVEPAADLAETSAMDAARKLGSDINNYREKRLHAVAAEVQAALQAEKKAARSEVTTHKKAQTAAQALKLAKEHPEAGITLKDAEAVHGHTSQAAAKALHVYKSAWARLRQAEHAALLLAQSSGNKQLTALAQSALVLADQRDSQMRIAAAHTAAATASNLTAANAARRAALAKKIAQLSQHLNATQLKQAEQIADEAYEATVGGGKSYDVVGQVVHKEGEAVIGNASVGVGDDVAKQLKQEDHQHALQSVMKAELETQEAKVLKEKAAQTHQRLQNQQQIVHKVLNKLGPVIAASENGSSTHFTLSAKATKRDALRGYQTLERSYHQLQHTKAALQHHTTEHNHVAHAANYSIVDAQYSTQKVVPSGLTRAATGDEKGEAEQEDQRAAKQLEATKKNGTAQNQAVTKAAGDLIVHAMTDQKIAASKLEDPALQPLPNEQAAVGNSSLPAAHIEAEDTPDDDQIAKAAAAKAVAQIEGPTKAKVVGSGYTSGATTSGESRYASGGPSAPTGKPGRAAKSVDADAEIAKAESFLKAVKNGTALQLIITNDDEEKDVADSIDIASVPELNQVADFETSDSRLVQEGLDSVASESVADAFSMAFRNVNDDEDDPDAVVAEMEMLSM